MNVTHFSVRLGAISPSRPRDFKAPRAGRVKGDPPRSGGIGGEAAPAMMEPDEDGWAWLADIQGELDDDFVASVMERPAEQERLELDVFE